MAASATSQPIVTITHKSWRHWGPLDRAPGPASDHAPYRASLLHTSLREPTGYLGVDLYPERDDHRADLEFMTATFAAWGGTVASDVYAFADADEGCRIVERLRAAQATLGDTGQVDLDATGDLQNHVVGFTRVPHLPVDVERDVAAALAEREAESLTALLQLRLAAPWGGLLVDFSHSEEEWWHEHHFATGLYERHGATTDARLYSFIDRLHETAIDRLVRQLAVDVR